MRHKLYLSSRAKNNNYSSFWTIQLKDSAEGLRYLQLLIQYFNLCSSTIVYKIKITALIFGIMGGFASIHLSSTGNLLFCLIYTILFLDAIICYIGIFNSVFKLTEGVEEIKREIRLQSTQLHGQSERREIRMRIQSIPKLAIRAGGFQNVEREATLIFLSFVLSQIVSLLIAF